MRFNLSIVMFFILFSAFAQEKSVEVKVVDSLYREDQFYTNITYNNLQNTPSGLSQNKFSPGFSIGFLRDMPVNKSRTFALAAGLGYSFSIYNDDLYLYQTTDGSGNTVNNYEVISSDIYFKKNKLALHFIELPIEIRWRSSTPESHKFWRIYTGFKLSYLVGDRYKFVNDVQTVVIKNNPDINKLQYGCYLTVGWNGVNLYAYYGLSSIYKNAQIGGKDINMNSLNMGFQFYIL